MTLFSVEANGRPVAVFAALDQDDANSVLARQRDEFVTIGACDEADDLCLREAADDEGELWREVVQAAVSQGEFESAEVAEIENYMILLVPECDSTDDLLH